MVKGFGIEANLLWVYIYLYTMQASTQEEGSFSTRAIGYLYEKNQSWFLPHFIHKIYFQMDYRPKFER